MPRLGRLRISPRPQRPSLRHNSCHVEPSCCEMLHLTSFQSRINIIFDIFVISFQLGWNCVLATRDFRAAMGRKYFEDKTLPFLFREKILRVIFVEGQRERLLEIKL